MEGNENGEGIPTKEIIGTLKDRLALYETTPKTMENLTEERLTGIQFYLSNITAAANFLPEGKEKEELDELLDIVNGKKRISSPLSDFQISFLVEAINNHIPFAAVVSESEDGGELVSESEDTPVTGLVSEADFERQMGFSCVDPETPVDPENVLGFKTELTAEEQAKMAAKLDNPQNLTHLIEIGKISSAIEQLENEKDQAKRLDYMLKLIKKLSIKAQDGKIAKDLASNILNSMKIFQENQNHFGKAIDIPDNQTVSDYVAKQLENQPVGITEEELKERLGEQSVGVTKEELRQKLTGLTKDTGVNKRLLESIRRTLNIPLGQTISDFVAEQLGKQPVGITEEKLEEKLEEQPVGVTEEKLEKRLGEQPVGVTEEEVKKYVELQLGKQPVGITKEEAESLVKKYKTAQSKPKRAVKRSKPRKRRTGKLAAILTLGALGLYSCLGIGKPYNSIEISKDKHYGQTLVVDGTQFHRNPLDKKDPRFYPSDVIAKIERGETVSSNKWIMFRAKYFKGGADVNHDGQKDLIDSNGNTYTSRNCGAFKK